MGGTVYSEKYKMTQTFLQQLRKSHELEDRTAEAIILLFKDNLPIIRFEKYNIPSPYMISESLVRAVREYCEVDYTKGRPNFNQVIEWRLIKNPDELQKRVHEAINIILDRHGDREARSRLEEYMYQAYRVDNDSPLDGRWFFYYGDLFKFKQEEQKQIENKVQQYWTKEELTDFKALGKFMLEYVNEEYRSIRESLK